MQSEYAQLHEAVIPEIRPPATTLFRRLRAAAFLAGAGLILAGCGPDSYDAAPVNSPLPTASQGQKTELPATPDERLNPPVLHPNIVYIIADDLDNTLYPYMPHVKQLITNRGTKLTNFTFNIPQCCPSRSTILRGQYAQNTGVSDNGGSRDGSEAGGYKSFYKMGDEVSTLPVWLQQGGYTTALYGKYMNGYPDGAVGSDGEHLPLTHVPVGWDDWRGGEAGIYNQYNYTVNVNGDLEKMGSKPEDYFTDVLSKWSVAFIDAQTSAAKPFYLEVTPTAPHEPAVPAPRDVGTFDGITYPHSPNFNEADVSDKPSYIQGLNPITSQMDKAIDETFQARVESAQAVDDMVQAIYNELQQTGQLDNTIIIFGSDNGYHQGSHRLDGSPNDIDSGNKMETASTKSKAKGGKDTGYAEDVVVDLSVAGPGIVAGGTLSQEISNADIAPTISAMTGITTPSFIDGRSAWPLLQGQTIPWREAVPIMRGDGINFHGFYSTNFAYIEYEDGEYELYDRRTDPFQLNNLYETLDSQTKLFLSQRSKALNSCSGADCRQVDQLPIPDLVAAN